MTGFCELGRYWGGISGQGDSRRRHYARDRRFATDARRHDNLIRVFLTWLRRKAPRLDFPRCRFDDG